MKPTLFEQLHCQLKQVVRVAHVVGQMRVGGMEKLLIEFARHADRAAVEPLFVSLGARGPICHELESLNCNVITLHRGEGFRPSALLRLAAIFRGLRVDIVHTHNLRPLIYGAPAARLARAPAVVHSRHGQQFGASRAEILRLRWASRLVDRMTALAIFGLATRTSRRPLNSYHPMANRTA